MEAARSKDYVGVAFFYHRITDHVIVEWAETDIDNEARISAERMLYTFFRDRVSGKYINCETRAEAEW